MFFVAYSYPVFGVWLACSSGGTVAPTRLARNANGSWQERGKVGSVRGGLKKLARGKGPRSKHGAGMLGGSVVQELIIHVEVLSIARYLILPSEGSVPGAF
jgi:hypothetical protein